MKMWNFGVNVTVFLLIVLFNLPSCITAGLSPQLGLSLLTGVDFEYDDVVDSNYYNYVEYESREEDDLSNIPETAKYDASTKSYTNSETWQYNNITTEGYVFEYNDTDSEDNNRTRDTKYLTLLIEPEYRVHWKKVNVIQSACPKNETCARKCCPLNLAYDPLKNKCIETADTFRPAVWYGYTLLENVDAVHTFTFLNGRIICPAHLGEVRKLVTDISPSFRLESDGNLYVESREQLEFKTNKYCIDLFVAADGTTDINALICHAPHKDLDQHYLMSGICMIITCFLVLLRVLVFAWVPERQTLHGMILMAYLISFMVGFLLLGLEQFLTMKHVTDETICVTLTLIIHFSILSAFFWRNVMCFDIWWTFSGFRLMSFPISSSRTYFRRYCAYAFGLPTVLTVILSAIEFSSIPIEHPLMPRIRINCSLYGYARLLYFLGPLMILFLMNMIFFTLTALKIATVTREMRILQNENSNCTQKPDTKQFVLYTKLFASMLFLEVNLVLEVTTILHSETVDLLHLTDIFNVLIPFIIIVNFLCRKQTWRMIKKRYRQMRSLPISQGQLSRNTPNSHSHDDLTSDVTHL